MRGRHPKTEFKKDRPEARIDYTKRAWTNATKLLA